ncbi:hypothetical protein DOT66_16520 [Ralstonia pseudosolanacearum]|uniref:hypothetical protein n=1 Tax=Ralstonia pseudosolanacearum TaxID=1310165 RepID=UPI000B60E0E2|nr:hypothetical protein [Ralstonia pseudosolanacearum]ASL74693.1 hypothetical protein BC350_14535 [Ralstonia pseudosolanacearum]RAA07655.1 hypothetical protein DOT66_16520 [Ralstonia pseudosolanacearum]
MSSITTSFCEATRIDIKPVRFLKQPANTHQAEYVFATQCITVTLHDGNTIELVFHLPEGVTSLAAGETVVFPSVDEVLA